MVNKTSHFEFGPFLLDTVQKLLLRGEEQLPVTPKAFDTLMALVEADGRIVEKEELLKRVWPDTFVEEGSLSRNISVLRKVLGESPDDQKYIQTIPRRGYRFVAAVRGIPDAGHAALEQQQPRDPSGGDVAASVQMAPGRSRKSWITGLAIAILALAFFVVWLTNRRVTAPIRSIAVLPFENVGRDPAQDYYAEGITDALITSLAQIRSLKTISRTSVMRYKATVKPLPEIARELGVDAVLEGSVQRDGNQIRITAQLIHAASDTHLWAQVYDRDVADILRLEGELASAVAHEVRIHIGPETRNRFRNAPQIASAAQDEYLMARHHQENRSDPHLELAIQHFEAVVRLEPNFAPAYASLSHVWLQRGVLGRSGFRESETPARKAALRALALDPDLAEAHEALAQILMFYDLDWTASEREYRQAIELDPNNVYAHVYYATLLEVLRRFPEAIDEGQRSLALDPVSTTVNSEYGRVLFRARKYDEAIRQYLRTLELDPKDNTTRHRLAEAYLQTGRFAEAMNLDIPALRIRTYASAGRRAEARQILSSMLDTHPRNHIEIALDYFALGERDRGLDRLANAFDERQYVNLVVCDPRFDAVRDDPRFRALVARLGLQEVWK